MLKSEKDLTCTFRASCYSARFSWALVLTWVSHFVNNKKNTQKTKQTKIGFGLGGNRLCRYDIRAEGALPPSITMIARQKMFGYWKYVRLEYFKGDCSANFE